MMWLNAAVSCHWSWCKDASITVTSYERNVKSPATQLFVQQCVPAYNKKTPRLAVPPLQPFTGKVFSHHDVIVICVQQTIFECSYFFAGLFCRSHRWPIPQSNDKWDILTQFHSTMQWCLVTFDTVGLVITCALPGAALLSNPKLPWAIIFYLYGLP